MIHQFYNNIGSNVNESFSSDQGSKKILIQKQTEEDECYEEKHEQTNQKSLKDSIITRKQKLF